MIRFSYTILYVSDIEETIAFYEKAFECARKFVIPDGSYGELSTGSTTLSFASIEQANSNLKNGFKESNLTDKPAAFEIGFTTDDVAGVYARAIMYGAIAEAEPAEKPHGQTVAYVRDPNGFLVEICTQME